MLVAQLKNQDPMSPMDNAAMTSQMAQISTVQGIEKLNSTMATYAAANGKSGRAVDSVGLVGQGVLAAGNQATVPANSSAPVVAGVYLPAAADLGQG
jgi:flagellar basal-body rod modification protein FlgD